MKKNLNLITCCCALLLLTGCGGGGDESSSVKKVSADLSYSGQTTKRAEFNESEAAEIVQRLSNGLDSSRADTSSSQSTTKATQSATQTCEYGGSVYGEIDESSHEVYGRFNECGIFFSAAGTLTLTGEIYSNHTDEYDEAGLIVSRNLLIEEGLTEMLINNETQFNASTLPAYWAVQEKVRAEGITYLTELEAELDSDSNFSINASQFQSNKGEIKIYTEKPIECHWCNTYSSTPPITQAFKKLIDGSGSAIIESGISKIKIEGGIYYLDSDGDGNYERSTTNIEDWESN